MSCKVITFINMKGGVGKTTLCLSLGEYLANHLSADSKKILFLDVDPQFNLTQSLLNEFNREDDYLEKVYRDKDICKIFETKKTLSKEDAVPDKSLIIELSENIHLVPGSIDLIFEDSKNDITKTKKIDRFIEKNHLKKIYDFIFIDCPPTITLYTDAALFASDYYIIPNRVDRYSVLGINLLQNVVNRLKRDMEIDINPLGVVYMALSNDLTMKTKELMDIFEKEEVIRDLYIFQGRTSYVKDLSVGYQGNIASKYKKSRNDISNIAREFLAKI